MDKLDKLNSLLGLLQNDTITPKEMEQFLLLILDVVKKTKDGFETVTAERVQELNSILVEIQNKHAAIVSEVTGRTSVLESTFTERIAEVKAILDEVKAIEVRDGLDGKDADEQRVIDEVTKTLESKIPTFEPETGEGIVDKINDIPEDGPKIDASHIKNLPQAAQRVYGGTRMLSKLVDVNVTDIQDNDVLQWNAATGRFENAQVSGGSGSGITSINADTTAAQLLTVGTSGTDFAIVDNGTGTHTFNLPTASATNRGALSSADWTTFNNKFNLPSLTAGSVLFSNGSTIAQDNANFFFDDSTNQLKVAGSILSPLIIGSTSTTGDLTLQTTSGVGTTGADMHFLVGNNGGTEAMTILNSGNVGIGTTAPGYRLEVNGDALFNGVRVGLGGGSIAQNTVVGNGAINAVASGNYNSAFGYNALNALTNGNYNTAIGRMAMLSATTGSNNIAIGASAMQGYNGTQSVAIGFSSMSGAATGNYSVGIGGNTLVANTGDYQVAVGYGALTANTSGIRNTAVGASALATNTTGQLNVAVGELSLNLSNSSNNTAIGRQAGYNVSSGANNTFLGFQSGMGITTGANNTIIGSATGLSSSLANTIILADGEGNQRLYINSGGNVGIGTTAPGGKLDVNYANGTYGESNPYFMASYGGTQELKVYMDGAYGFNFKTYGTTGHINLLPVGNVGIGTTAPGSKLSVSGSAAQIAEFVSSNSGSSYFLIQDGSATPVQSYYGVFGGGLSFQSRLNTGAAYPIRFINGNSESVRIDTAGNVGIGTTSPGAKLDVSGTILGQRLVEANTAGSGSPNIITAGESRTLFTNEGATALNYETLPTAAAGLTYTFYVQDADGIRVTANTGDVININGVASSTAGYCQSTNIGSSITLTAINATDWVATSVVGTWTLA